MPLFNLRKIPVCIDECIKLRLF